MKSNRRAWLKQIGLGVAAAGLAPLESLALPAARYFEGADQQQPIRLRSNENPYGPSSLVRKAMTERIGQSNRYSWELTASLIAALAERHHLLPGNILTGAGSTEMLDTVARLAALKQGSYILADPTFDYWTETAYLSGLQKIKIPLTGEKRHDLPAMLRAMQPDTRLIYICNPNNPTGTVCENEALTAFITAACRHTLVMVDEAYIDFTQEKSVAQLVQQHKNLIVLRTFSKIYGLAGARVGYAIAHADTIEQLSRLQSAPGGSVSAVSAAGAIAALQDKPFVAETYAANEKVRQFTCEQLERLHIPYIPSATNFLYFSLAHYKKDFFEQLKQGNITGTKIYEEDGQWSRITIGTFEEMQQFIRAIS